MAVEFSRRRRRHQSVRVHPTLLVARGLSKMILTEYRHVKYSTLESYLRALEEGWWRRGKWAARGWPPMTLRECPRWIQFKRGLAAENGEYVPQQQKALLPEENLESGPVPLSPRAVWCLAVVRAGWLRLGDLDHVKLSNIMVKEYKGARYTVISHMRTKEWLRGPRRMGTMPSVRVPCSKLATPLPPALRGGEKSLMPPQIKGEILDLLKAQGFGDHSARIGGVVAGKMKGVKVKVRKGKARHRSLAVHAHYGRAEMGPEEAEEADA